LGSGASALDPRAQESQCGEALNNRGMKGLANSFLFLVCVGLLLTGCAISPHSGFNQRRAQMIEESVVARNAALTPELEEKILALDPNHVSQREVTEILSNAPAPRVINIHGGVLPFELAMKSFSKFMIGMGYPEWSVRNPWNGTHSYSCYQNSKEMAGMIAWYYEHEGMPPMILGHSVGGMQVVKVLHEIADDRASDLRVWNPLLRKWENRSEIIDPPTRQPRPVTKVSIPFASSLAAGGLARTLPSQWGTNGKLRTIPDSVEEFTGFCIGLDIWGGDYLGFGSANSFHSGGKAVVRNVRLPTGASHSTVPDTEKLLKDQSALDWINNFTPKKSAAQTAQHDAHVLWVADVWYSIKKHWVIELQRMIRARRGGNIEPGRLKAELQTHGH
jgi:hypothetical protein